MINNQNIETQIFIIKQIERKDQAEFENKFNKFLGKSGSSLNNIFENKLNYFDSSLKSIEKLYNKDRKNSYLIPLIYNKSEYEGYKFEKIELNSQEDNIDAYYYDKNQKAIKLNSSEISDSGLYFNSKFENIKKCPLLDFTKLAYIFQTSIDNFLGMSDVTSFNVTLNTQSISSANITLNNFDFKFNFTNEDDLINSNTLQENNENLMDNIYKSVFDTNDIVILRISKRQKKIEYEQKTENVKYKDLYSSGINDYFQTIFTGFINNVNESINWNTKNQTININCSGPSKLITYCRLITGQATADQDYSSAIIPISVYNIPQSIEPDGTYSLKNKDIIKNIACRVLTSIDNIPVCHDSKENFNKAFIKNFNNSEANNTIINKITDNRKIYNDNIFSNFNKFADESNDNGIIQIYTNIFKKNKKDTFLPIFVINGTNQPGSQYVFNTFNNLFVATYETVYQYIKKIADTLNFVFYDDPYGIIHFELIDTDITHLYDSNDSNNFSEVISVNIQQNTDSINNIMPVYGEGEFANVLNGQALGLGAVVRDQLSIKKYGERPMSPINIVGIIDKKACERYGRDLMDKMNRKIVSYSLSMIGDPSIKLAKYGYLKDFKKLFYIENITHEYNAGSNLTTNITGSYERNILLNVLEVNNPFNAFKIPKIESKNKMTQFLYIKNQITSLLSNNFDINDIMINEAKTDVKNKIINKLKKNYYYFEENTSDKEYLNQLFNEDQIPYLLFDGFFWNHPMVSDLYKQANAIQQKTIQENIMKSKNKKGK